MEEQSKDEVIFYRGESKKYDSPCTPSLFRYMGNAKSKLKIEKEYYDLSIEYLKKSQFNIKPSEANDEILSYIKYISLMQHYGFGTRLLDISSKLEIAKYFACCSDFDKDGYIYVFDEVHNIKQLKSIKAQNVRRKFECIFKVNEIEKYDNINDYYSKINNSNIQLDTITTNVILSYETLFDTTIDNIRYERQSGSFIVTGNPLNDEHKIDDSYNTIHYQNYMNIESNKKIRVLLDLNKQKINHVYLFPDEDDSIKLVAILKYLLTDGIDKQNQYNFFIKNYKNYFFSLKDKSSNDDGHLNNEYFLSINSKLYNEILNENTFYFFFVEFRDYIKHKFKNSYDIVTFIKKNENITLKEIIESL